MPWLIALGALGLVVLTAGFVAKMFGRAIGVITGPVTWTPQHWYAIHITPSAMLPSDPASGNFVDVLTQISTLQKMGFGSITQGVSVSPHSASYIAQFIGSVTKPVLNSAGMWLEEVKAPPSNLVLPPLAVAVATPPAAAVAATAPPAAASAGDAWGR